MSEFDSWITDYLEPRYPRLVGSEDERVFKKYSIFALKAASFCGVVMSGPIPSLLDAPVTIHSTLGLVRSSP